MEMLLATFIAEDTAEDNEKSREARITDLPQRAGGQIKQGDRLKVSAKDGELVFEKRS